MLPALPSNEKNSSNHHNFYNKGPNLAFFSFTKSPSNSLLTIRFPKNQHTSSSYSKMPKIAMAKIWPLMGFRSYVMIICLNPRHHKLQGSFHSCKTTVLSLYLLQHYNLELFHVALSPMSPIYHVLSCFSNLKLYYLYLVIFIHPYLAYMKYNSINV